MWKTVFHCYLFVRLRRRKDTACLAKKGAASPGPTRRGSRLPRRKNLFLRTMFTSLVKTGAAERCRSFRPGVPNPDYSPDICFLTSLPRRKRIAGSSHGRRQVQRVRDGLVVAHVHVTWIISKTISKSNPYSSHTAFVTRLTPVSTKSFSCKIYNLWLVGWLTEHNF